jgi:lysine 2,3-aminomutase
MRRLCQGQLRIRVRPYYLHQCDAIVGSMPFRTPIQTGLDLIRALHGHTTGYAVPTYMVDAPGGGGKVPLAPDYVVVREGMDWKFRNYAGRVYHYREGDRRQDAPAASDIPPPSDRRMSAQVD